MTKCLFYLFGFSAFLLLTQLNQLSAQEIRVLESENNQPLVGATVEIIKDNNSSVILSTDENGKLKLNEALFNRASLLSFKVSYIGYEAITDTISPKESKAITLKPKDYLIDDVVVTAQYSPTSIENSVHKIKVISSQEIENMAAVNLKDVLTNELNVRISQDNVLGSGMSLQGISGQNVKILIDGVPVIGRLDGQIDLNQINLNNIERIEIVEGPLSVNYGSNALAGTINIITKKDQKQKVSVGIDSYNESIGKFNLESRLGFKLAKNHSLSLSLGRNYFDGWSPNDEFLPSFSAQLADSNRVKQWNPKEQYFGRLQYHFNYKKLRFSYKGEYFDEVIRNYGAPRRTANSYIAFDDYYHTHRIDNALFAEGQLTKNWRINWTAAYNDFERIKEARRKDLVTLESRRIPESANNDLQDTSTFNLFMTRGSIARTKDSTWINYEIGYDINIENASGKRIEGGEQQIGDYALFVSYEVNLINGLIVKPAIRYSYNTQYDAPLTPSLNLKYALNKSAFRFSYAKGFRAPSLKELYFNFNDVNHSLFGNSNLKAETSDNYSAALQQKFLLKEILLKAELSAFYNQIYNQINFAQTNLGGDSLEYFNVGKSQTKGLNLNLTVLYENLQFNLGASYTGRSNRLAEDNPIDLFSYTTEYIANFSYRFKKPQLTIAAFAKHQGELPGFGYNSDGEISKQTIDSYQIFDATISKFFWKQRLNVALGCKNILDVQNVRASLSGGGAHSSGGSSISVGTGRTLFLKLSLSFKKQ